MCQKGTNLNIILILLRVQHNETNASVSYVRGNASVTFNVNVQAQLFSGAVPRWVKQRLQIF